VRVRRRAATEKAQRGRRFDLVPGARRNQDGITHGHRLGFPVDLHGAFALQHEIELLALLVIVPFGRAPGRQTGLGEALIENGRIGPVEDAANPGTVSGRKGFLAGYVQDNHRKFAPMRFYEGCTALITGASSGLGEEFARQLAPYAQALVLVARRLDRLNILKAELEGAYRSLTVHVYGADLGREDQRVAFVNWLPSQQLSIDFLINNAGLGDRGPFESSDWNRIRTILDVNISALTHLIHLLLPSMTLSGRAAILNVSSVAGFLPLPNTAVYAATKAYVTSLSESLAIELRPRGITVTALCPGPIATEFHSVSLRPGAATRESHVESMPAFVVTPEEAVRAALVAVSRRRARVIPGLLLCVSILLATMVPFCITREVLRVLRNRL
jgi:short-subunit dehydrogenase